MGLARGNQGSGGPRCARVSSCPPEHPRWSSRAASPSGGVFGRSGHVGHARELPGSSGPEPPVRTRPDGRVVPGESYLDAPGHRPPARGTQATRSRGREGHRVPRLASRDTGRVGGPHDGASRPRRRPSRSRDTVASSATIAESGPQSTAGYLSSFLWSDWSDAPGLGLRERRRQGRSAPPDVLVVTCGTQQHRVSLPSCGPIVLFDHPDRASVDAALERRGDVEGCAKILLYVRGRASYKPYGWWKWSVHVAPSFGKAGSAIAALSLPTRCSVAWWSD